VALSADHSGWSSVVRSVSPRPPRQRGMRPVKRPEMQPLEQPEMRQPQQTERQLAKQLQTAPARCLQPRLAWLVPAQLWPLERVWEAPERLVNRQPRTWIHTSGERIDENSQLCPLPVSLLAPTLSTAPAVARGNALRPSAPGP
jgi:hypothetical protein